MYFNAKGELKEIAFAETSSTANENKFTKKQLTSAKYRKTPNTFGGEIWLEDDAFVFILPESINYKKGYSVQCGKHICRRCNIYNNRL